MGNITDKIKEVSENNLDKFCNDRKFQEFKTYLREMKSKGLIKPETYNLPPLDTVGKRLYQSKSTSF
ncbi:MAG: hypothetical protein K8R53_11100 [Bacteroidales bacterium]|nr:hypothetical protein [Bacteroidales bacterium]